LLFINLDKHVNDGQRLDERVIETHEKKTPIKLSLLLFDWVFFSAESMSRLYLYVAAGLSPDYYPLEQYVSKAFRRPKKTQKWFKLPKLGLSTNSDNRSLAFCSCQMT